MNEYQGARPRPYPDVVGALSKDAEVELLKGELAEANERIAELEFDHDRTYQALRDQKLYLALDGGGHGVISVASSPQVACFRAAEQWGLYEHTFTATEIDHLSRYPWSPDEKWSIYLPPAEDARIEYPQLPEPIRRLLQKHTHRPEDPLLSPADARAVWEIGFSCGWRKSVIVAYIQAAYGVKRPKDLRKSQAAAAMAYMRTSVSNQCQCPSVDHETHPSGSCGVTSPLQAYLSRFNKFDVEWLCLACYEYAHEWAGT